MARKSFEQLEEEIRKLKPLKFKDIIPISYKETIRLLIGGTPTYLNSEKKPQCGVNRSRGLRDIYRTVLYYYPETSFKDVFNETCNNGSSSFCNETNQTVFHPVYRTYTSDKPNVQVRLGRTPYYIENLKKSNDW